MQQTGISDSLFLKMDDESFNRLSSYVTKEYGIKLPPSKRSMLESRLNKKVKALGMDNYKNFLDYIFSEEGKQSELFHVVDLITTNKTDFFREPAHFEFLTNDFLPQKQNEGKDLLNFWSAGCSTGE
ncbi:CheR family methyltransferase, partial [Chryseosolibacter indicus]